MSIKTLIAVFLITALSIVGLTYYSSVHAKNDTAYVNPAYKEYVAAYTAGYIPVDSKITIVLQEETNNSIEEGKETDNTLFEFSPSVQGTITWIDKKTIEFKPAQRLNNNQTYKAKFHLGNVLGVSDDLKEFEFEFSTLKQAMEITIGNYKTTGTNVLEIDGTLTTADYADNLLVEKTMQVNQGQQSLQVTWLHENSTTHHFTISNVQKGKGELVIAYNGEPIGASETGKQQVAIPNTNEFTLLNVLVDNEPDQFVTLQFSDKIDPNQNLEGLISISNSGATANVSNENEYNDNVESAPATESRLSFMIENNTIKIYTGERYTEARDIIISNGVKNSDGKHLKEAITYSVFFEDLKPAVKLVGKGVILPSSNGLIFPFEAVNLNAVDVRITRVYEKNMLQFLQVNSLEGSQELRRVGKLIVKKKVALQPNGNPTRNKWSKYSIDLSSLIKAEPGALYNIRLSFNRNYSIYNCQGDTSSHGEDEEYVDRSTDNDEEKEWDYYNSYDDYYDDYYYYDYSERNNPCSRAYYNNKSVNRNILSTNIGLIAKRGNNGQINIFASDIISAKPLANVSVEAYDYQQQKLKQVTTNGEGIAVLETKFKPFVLIAKRGQERTYLKLDDGNSLSLSSFEVDGDVVQKGVKGFIYGERGVWRPGDSLYLSFILENKAKEFPENYPASLELLNPQGQVVQKLTRTKHVDGFYNFATKTENAAPTGVYLAKVKVGGAVFTKNIRIETIMPNRLKINLDYKRDKIYSTDLSLNSPLEIKWLHGAPGRNLETKIDVSLSQMDTEFKGYKGFTFDNPAQNFSSETQTIFTGTTNDEGFVDVKAELNDTKNAPGFLAANFTIRAFEEGGAFSTDRFTIPVSPYTHYVGVKVPETKDEENYLETDIDHRVEIATVDEFGKATSRSNIEVKVYKLDWRWWWDNYNQDLSSYIGSNYHEPIYTEQISSLNGKANFKLRVNRPSWGRYLVYVKDVESGHACGKVVFIDWPSWAGKSPKGNEGSNVLTINTDKTDYKVGDKAKILIPSPAGGKVLINIENGSRTLLSKWIDTKEGTTEYEFTVTKEMTPNIYAFVHLIQPHAQTANDLPIRLYGVAALMIKDDNTILKPQINTTAVWKPESQEIVKVSEANGKEMAYTLAVVDEGLLDITRFKTPDPWKAFYAKEALGVKTWDVYDNVIGTFGNAMSRILSIGGDDAANMKPENSAQRFKPMVRFIGPFHLKKGETATHKIDIPQYVGSVRVMVVAGYQGAYGNTEKAVPVRKPLMILSTLPRVLGPGEEVNLPVTVFAMEKKVKMATVTVTTDKFAQTVNGNSQIVSFSGIGDKVINFKLKIKDALGVAKIKITAKGAGETTSETIEIAVRANNPSITDAEEFLLTSAKSLNTSYVPIGISGTNKAYLELSTLPSINLSQRLNYLVEYPHGCVEQTTSSVFAGLYINDISELSVNQKAFIDNATKAAITRLKQFQTASGGLSYWPGLNEANEWGTNYAGHFLIEAKAKGYSLPYGLLDNWKKYQKQKAQGYVNNKNTAYYGEDLTQAYRLYTLALAGTPELGAMNRLKEKSSLANEVKWRLAAAYAIAGQLEVAKKMVFNISINAKVQNDYYYTYGSTERDDAMILETMTLLKDNNNAFLKVKSLAAKLGNNEYWLSTQSTAYCLMAISKYAKLNGNTSALAADVNIGNDAIAVSDFNKSKYKLIELKNPNASTSVKVTVKGGGNLFARLVKQGIPKAGEETDKFSNLELLVNYKTLTGNPIDVNNLEQGTDFMAEVTIKNPGVRGMYRNLALTQIFASGWEIRNQRLDNITYLKGDVPTYQDIRDDRVYSYFDMGVGSIKTFKVLLNSSYTGTFYLPGVSCEAMYDNSISAHIAGKWVTVRKQGEIL
ncbi:MAG: MG2 domain-containing protein [Bacteroidota bacterium]